MIPTLNPPYLLFVGAADDPALAKTAFGVRDWAASKCLAQLRDGTGTVDLGLPDMNVEQAAAAGARSLLIGVAPIGGAIPDAWLETLLRAARAGMDIVSGMHSRLTDVPRLATEAARSGARLIDVRHPRQTFPTATGRPRTGKRLLTVGTDCALGKKYTALALARALQQRGIAADFRATGQTGIMISGGGIAIDAVVADFIAGAAETLSPDAAPDHWDVIEGQGSLFHPAYAGVTTGLIHGSQPDVLVLCHDPSRTHVWSLSRFPLPSLEDAAARNLATARLTNPRARLAAIALNTSRLDAASRERAISETTERMEVPCFDPLLSQLDNVLASVLA